MRDKGKGPKVQPTLPSTTGWGQDSRNTYGTLVHSFCRNFVFVVYKLLIRCGALLMIENFAPGSGLSKANMVSYISIFS